jgi:hypothetical protein
MSNSPLPASSTTATAKILAPSFARRRATWVAPWPYPSAFTTGITAQPGGRLRAIAR